MPTKPAATNVFTDAIVTTLEQTQQLATAGLDAWAELAGKSFAVPSFDAVPFAAVVPDPREAVELSFGFAEKLLATQKELAVKFVDAVTAPATKSA